MDGCTNLGRWPDVPLSIIAVAVLFMAWARNAFFSRRIYLTARISSRCSSSCGDTAKPDVTGNGRRSRYRQSADDGRGIKYASSSWPACRCSRCIRCWKYFVQGVMIRAIKDKWNRPTASLTKDVHEVSSSPLAHWAPAHGATSAPTATPARLPRLPQHPDTVDKANTYHRDQHRHRLPDRR